ncbi:MAG: hypothetical protein M1326_04185 [Cyanobacteria bacterium]|nr:hypothetical protein [Cyanobacteriota bacterium]
MPFNDKQEEIIEKAQNIIKKNENVIMDEFNRFNTIDIGNIKKDRINCEIQLMYPEIARVMNFDLDRYFKDRYYNFEKTFEYRIWHHENVPDDSAFSGLYEMDYGVYTMEYSLLDMETKWPANQYPVLGEPIIKNKRDLKNLNVPDFFTSGYMPMVIDDYKRLKEELKGRLNIGIRKFVHGPFQVAKDIRGLSNLYMDVFTDPEFVKDLLDFGVRFHEEWIRGWEQLHGIPYGRVDMAEDEIDTKKAIPPKIYKDLIFPFHVRLGNKYKNIHFHSCGDINVIAEDIKEIPQVTLIEIGPKTDAFEYSKVFKGTNVKFYKCPDPVSELLSDDAQNKRKMIENVIKASELVPIKILVETPSLEKGLEFLKLFRKLYD